MYDSIPKRRYCCETIGKETKKRFFGRNKTIYIECNKPVLFRGGDLCEAHRCPACGWCPKRVYAKFCDFCVCKWPGCTDRRVNPTPIPQEKKNMYCDYTEDTYKKYIREDMAYDDLGAKTLYCHGHVPYKEAHDRETKRRNRYERNHPPCNLAGCNNECTSRDQKFCPQHQMYNSYSYGNITYPSRYNSYDNTAYPSEYKANTTTWF